MIDALVISVKEPQIDRCLEGVRNQTVPFEKITHVDSIVPESEAFKRGMGMMNGEWLMKIDGDMILNNNAVEIVTRYMNSDKDDKICGYYFGLYDTFLEVDMGFCGVLRTKVYQSVSENRRDRLSEERETINELRKQGWAVRKLPKIIIGTHFDKPDEFQVFRKFYCSGVRANDNGFDIDRMTMLLDKTGDPLYSLGLKAIAFSKAKNRSYIGSRNIDFDRKLFEEFKLNGNNY